jgi:5'-deoxynucleotidase YfbR-like HD superfamily hydrolase
LLPERHCDGEEYDKDEIIQILLFHDLAEAYIGDYLPGEEGSRREEPTMRTVRFLDTFGSINRSQKVFELWNTFNSGATVEGRIAADIDKLEAAFQALLYRNSFPSPQVFEAFMEDHRDSIKTKTGQWLWRELARKFRLE